MENEGSRIEDRGLRIKGSVNSESDLSLIWIFKLLLYAFANKSLKSEILDITPINEI